MIRFPQKNDARPKGIQAIYKKSKKQFCLFKQNGAIDDLDYLMIT